MSDRNLPEINLELSGGSLTIRTAEAIYRIAVAGGLAALPAGTEPAPQALPPASEPSPEPSAEPSDEDWDDLDVTAPEPGKEEDLPMPEGIPEDNEYYRELSHDMYREVGRLARRLSMSIRDVKVDKVQDFDLEAAGNQLETAKDQLENVVKMTEKATLKIIDLGEKIQEAIDKARNIMERLEASEESEEGEAGEEASEAGRQLAEALDSLLEFISGLEEGPLAPLVEEAEAIQSELKGAGSQAPPEPEEEAPPEPEADIRFKFPLDLVFQTSYELCTNETVKKHIKAMWDAGPKAFDLEALEKALNQIAPKEPDEDNFLNLNLKEVLKALFTSTTVDKYKQVLKKMAGTADQIFLDQFLPMEAVPNTDAPAPKAPAKPAPAPAPAGPSPEVLSRLEGLVEKLRQASQSLTPPEIPADLRGLLDQALAVGKATGATDPQMKAELDKTMNVVFTSVNSIIEALSFQDISGQAIYRIVRLLTDFQVQLLAMVVSFGTKIKSKADRKEITTDESEKLAQVEVDKVMGTLGVSEAEEGEGEPARLDQGSVNSLLESMGF
ncbi:MAG: protein phosphatase CheZ [Desulfarculaceae bacterium]|jgi:chemotaxis regulatin CheY-phosphate phosphatase CheZ